MGLFDRGEPKVFYFLFGMPAGRRRAQRLALLAGN